MSPRLYSFCVNLLVHGPLKQPFWWMHANHMLSKSFLDFFFCLFEEMELFPASLATAHSHVFTTFRQVITSSTLKHISTIILSHSSWYMPSIRTYYVFTTLNCMLFHNISIANTTPDWHITPSIITAGFVRTDSDVPSLPVMSLKMKKWLGLS